MTGQVVIQNAKILNVVEKKSDDGKIVWYELVYMKDSDVNTVTVNQNTADILSIGDIYDLLMQITEILKTSKNGAAYKSHKFKIIDAFEIED